MSTATSADTYLRRQALWQQLLGIFRRDRPDGARCDRIATIAEVAIDQVFQGLNVPADEQARVYALVNDYASAASLYGYSLGRADALEGR